MFTALSKKLRSGAYPSDLSLLSSSRISTILLQRGSWGAEVGSAASDAAEKDDADRDAAAKDDANKEAADKDDADATNA